MDQMGMVVLMCDHWPLELAVNGHWYGALAVRRRHMWGLLSEGEWFHRKWGHVWLQVMAP